MRSKAAAMHAIARSFPTAAACDDPATATCAAQQAGLPPARPAPPPYTTCPRPHLLRAQTEQRQRRLGGHHHAGRGQGRGVDQRMHSAPHLSDAVRARVVHWQLL
jgi:hypothetical protein